MKDSDLWVSEVVVVGVWRAVGLDVLIGIFSSDDWGGGEGR